MCAATPATAASSTLLDFFIDCGGADTDGGIVKTRTLIAITAPASTVLTPNHSIEGCRPSAPAAKNHEPINTTIKTKAAHPMPPAEVGAMGLLLLTNSLTVITQFASQFLPAVDPFGL